MSTIFARKVNKILENFKNLRKKLCHALTNCFLIGNHIYFRQYVCSDERLIDFDECLIAACTNPRSFLAETWTQAAAHTKSIKVYY